MRYDIRHAGECPQGTVGVSFRQEDYKESCLPGLERIKLTNPLSRAKNEFSCFRTLILVTLQGVVKLLHIICSKDIARQTLLKQRGSWHGITGLTGEARCNLSDPVSM